MIDVIRWASERRGATVVVIEHDMSLVRKLADHVFVLHNGRLLAEGSVAADPGQRRGQGDLRGGGEVSARPRASRSTAWSAATATSTVVRGISGAVDAGEVLCVIGRNGVGKSTLLKLLFGELPCRGGSVRFEGRRDRARSRRRSGAPWASATARRSGRCSTT